MHIFVTAIFKARGGRADELEAILRSVVEPNRAEPGCISCALNRDYEDDHRFVFIEEWESLDHLEQHLQAPHITDALSRADACIAKLDTVILERLAGGPARSA